VYLNFTSGTTGVPKGAVTTHANIYWNTRASIESFHLTSEDIHLCMFPIFTHPHELFARPLSLGGTIVLTDNIYPKSIAKVISNHRVTCLMAISALYEALMRLYGYAPFDLSSLRIAESGGMHTNPTLVQKFKESFGIPISPVWGSTETTGISIATPIDRGYKAGSMGTSCPHYEVKIVGEDGEELPPDEIGEMVIRGPAVCSEYFNQPDETKRCMKDGWYFTGDLVKMDSDGYFFFMSRKAGMMKVGGMKVFPIEIEDVLMSHPQIAEAAVFKVQDQTHGEVPKALIVIKEGMELSTAEVRRYCEERLAKYKIPRIIEFTPQLPRNPGGKILYRELA
jgi:long-chain acyl-CoA synthetase